jgi:hypothetical protein
LNYAYHSEPNSFGTERRKMAKKKEKKCLPSSGGMKVERVGRRRGKSILAMSK